MINTAPIAFKPDIYASTMSWHKVALKAARETGEKCEHMTLEKVVIMLSPIEDGLGVKIKFKVSCSDCDKKFPITSEKMTVKFIKFYGL